MARSALILNNPTLKLAATEAGLAAGDAFQCQVTSARLTPQPTYQSIPSTGCAPSSQSPGRTGWQFDVAWLDDWGVDPSLSQYCLDHDTEPTWYEFVADTVQYPNLKATGQVYLAPGGYGGTFGDGSAAASTATWPCLDVPDITNTVALAADETTEADAELVDAGAV
jgi:hypothetical protein